MRPWLRLTARRPAAGGALTVITMVACSGAPAAPAAVASASSPPAPTLAAGPPRLMNGGRTYEVEPSVLVAGEEQLALRLPSGRRAPLPGVLVFHSAMGRTESVLAWCDRLARHGFAAVALDFYAGSTASSPDQARALRDAANTRAEPLKGVVERAWAALSTDERLQSRARFLLGWSFGGAWATYAGGVLPSVSGVVAFYGEAFTDQAQLYDALSAPLLLIGAERDTAPAPRALDAIVKQLRARGKAAELLLVPAGHGFAERRHPGHDAAAAEQTWGEVLRFLEAHAS